MAGTIQTEWLLEGQVRLLTAVGFMDLITVKTYDDEAMALYDAAHRPFHLVADVRQMKNAPPMRECLKMPSLWHKNLDLFVTVGAMRQPMMRFVFTVIARMAHLRYKDVSTLEEAQHYLITSDASLPALRDWPSLPSL